MSSTIGRKFAKRLKAMRKKFGLSQEELAEIFDVDSSYIGRLERLERNPSLETLDKMANGLGVKVHDLINFDRELEVDLKKPH